ncbi:MAG TPA: phosphatidate cytidylyltransferase [bacterium]|nr:phosphatidate cytidylyltransferase [bacterium]HOM26446.1 phosphatidate cytidylyltransferase [bacterium]
MYRIFMGSIIPSVYLFTNSLFFSLIICSFFLTLLFSLEFERWKNPGVWDYVLRKYGRIFKTPPGKLTGDTYFMLATFIILLFFKKDIAISSLFFLIFGDAGSGILGSKYGKTKIFPGKTLEGFIGGIIFNLIIAFFLHNFLNLPFYILLSGVLISSIVEILPLKIDDNLTVGIITAFFMNILNNLI